MNAKKQAIRILFSAGLLFLALVALAGCLPQSAPEPQATAVATTAEQPATRTAPSESAPALVIPGAEPDTTTPAGVVDAFYTWYLGPAQAAEQAGEGAPGRTGEFSESPYLTQRLIRAVTEAVEGGFVGADPFLLAQEWPAAIRVEEVAAGPETAQVVLQQYWNLDVEESASWDLTLDLVREEGQWKIDRIQRGSPLTPDGVVQLFYNWYFGEGEYDRDLGSASYALAGAGNPLADRSYRESPYLVPTFVEQVDELLAEEEASSAAPAPYDPFLRARNHPRGFFVLAHEVERAGDEATVPVQVSYGQQQTTIVATVGREEGRWLIAGVQGELPDEATAAAQVVALFTDYYFGRWYAYAEDQDLPHTGEVDLSGFLAQSGHVYEESPFLSAAFAAGAGQAVSDNGGAVDPFFLAAAVPARVEIDEAWAEGQHAEVRVLQRWNEGHETRRLTVTLVREEGRWLIDGVVAAAGEANAPAPDPRAEMHPADVVRAFFAGYLAQGGFAGGAHGENGYLSPAYADSLENDVSYFESMGIPVTGYDPVLHSAAGALANMRVEVGEVTVDEERHTALARANRIYPGGASLPLTVMLTRDWDNYWTIQEIGAVDPEGMLAAGEELSDRFWLALGVAAWYDWAVAYGAQPEQVQALPDLLRFDMEAEGGITFCGSSWPQGFVVESAFIEAGAARGTRRASLVLRLALAEPGEQALLTLALEERDWQWAIVSQQCGDTPAGRARAFYTTYLGYHGDPVQARVYARGDFLTQDLIMAVDDGQAEGGVVDPFTLAEEQVQWFEVRAGEATNSAVVTLRFGDGRRQSLDLRFVLVDDRWLLSQVEAAE